MARTERTPLPAVIQEQRDLGNKWCSGCSDFHPFSDFGPSKDRPDGLSPLCRIAARTAGQRNHAKKMGDRYRPRVCEAVKADAPDGMTWCNIHATCCPIETFGRDPRKANGLQSSCNPGQVQKKSAKRTPPKRITSKYNPAPEGTRWCYVHGAYEPLATFRGSEKRCMEGSRVHQRQYPEYNAAKERNRRARKLGNGGSHTAKEIVNLGDQQSWLCGNPLCHADIRHSYDVDHIMPIVRKGADDILNLWLLCPTCNRKKSDRHPVEWATSLGLDSSKLWPYLKFIPNGNQYQVTLASVIVS